MQHPDFVFWSFAGFLLVILPAPWHWRARNIATLSLIFWVGLANLTVFVNTVVWADNYRDHTPVWCDISESMGIN
jgi:pheromone a factor receptor